MRFFEPVHNPPQPLLDYLLQEEQKNIRPCHDCGVNPGELHIPGCDVARCQATGLQSLACECGNCGEDIWTGLWPGVMEAYQWGYVCLDTCRHTLGFDLNRTAVRIILEKRGEDICSILD